MIGHALLLPRSKLLAVLAAPAALALAGCAQHPELSQTGRLGPGSFAFSPPTSGAGAEERARLETLVGARLTGAGLKAAPVETADYVVDIAASRSPRGVGAYAAPPGSPPPPVESWRLKPGRGGLVQISLVVTERATGRRLYQASATGRANPKKTSAVETALVAALPIPPKP